MKGDKPYLIHINECIERIERYVAQGGKPAFVESTLIQDAVLRNLQTLAESTQRLSDASKAALPRSGMVPDCRLPERSGPRLLGR
jgi:uncharacterized protein with HEPN domain